ncbi:MAG: VanZ family protein [Patulibacter minatonensis]
MITDLLLRHAALVPVLLAAVALASAAFGLALADRGRRPLAVVLGLSVAGMLLLTLWPASTGRGVSSCAVQFSVPAFGSVELLANIALFIPIGCFASLLTGHPLASLVAASLASVAVEGLQAALPAIGRACDTNDWAMNTAGAALGVAIAGVARLARRRTVA